MLFLLLLVLAAYVIGSTPTGYVIARAKGVDIRQHGSGNIGATNVFRILGKPWGIFVFVVDLAKGLLCTLGGLSAASRFPEHCPVSPVYAAIIAGIACILGHSFTFWLRFKGGKGVATALGVVFGLVPLAAAAGFVVWLIVTFTTRYVSLASILGALCVPIVACFTTAPNQRATLVIFSAVCAALIILRHIPNIKRLIAGTEHRFGTEKS